MAACKLLGESWNAIRVPLGELLQFRQCGSEFGDAAGVHRELSRGKLIRIPLRRERDGSECNDHVVRPLVRQIEDAALAREIKRPLKLIASEADGFRTTARHAITYKARVGLTPDGVVDRATGRLIVSAPRLASLLAGCLMDLRNPKIEREIVLLLHYIYEEEGGPSCCGLL